SRVHLPAPSLEEQAAALVGTSTEEPDQYSTRLHIVNRYYVQHLSMEEGYWLSAAVHSGTPVRLVVRDDPGHPRGHVVEGLTSTGEAFTGWCDSHDVPF